MSSTSVSALFCLNERGARGVTRRGLRGVVERPVIGCDHGTAGAAETPEVLERDESQLAAGGVVALAEQRHTRGEVQRLRSAGDVIVRGTDGARPHREVRVLSGILYHRRHKATWVQTLFPASRLRINLV